MVNLTIFLERMILLFSNIAHDFSQNCKEHTYIYIYLCTILPMISNQGIVNFVCIYSK